ncbi:MAG: hypothetical protein AB1478_01790, partial [Nitrospirota bacterium]
SSSVRISDGTNWIGIDGKPIFIQGTITNNVLATIHNTTTATAVMGKLTDGTDVADIDSDGKVNVDATPDSPAAGDYLPARLSNGTVFIGADGSPVFIQGTITNNVLATIHNTTTATAIMGKLTDGTDVAAINADGSVVADVTPATAAAGDYLPARITNGSDFIGTDGAPIFVQGTITNSVKLDHVAKATALYNKITDGTDDLAINNDGSINVISAAESGVSYSGFWEKTDIAANSTVTLGTVTISGNPFYPTYINCTAEGRGVFTFLNGATVIGKSRATNIMTFLTYPIGQGTSIPVGNIFEIKFTDESGAVQTASAAFFGKQK